MNKIGVIIAISLFTLIGVSAAIAITNTNNNSNQTQNALNETNPNGSNSNQGASAEPEEGEVSVEISNFEYAPETVTVKAGTTVTWTNLDSTEHDVTPDENGAFEQGPLLSQGQSYSYTFEEPGTYDYHCTPHPHMTGTVIVE